MPVLRSRYFTSGAALRASSVGDSSGMAVTRNTSWACAVGLSHIPANTSAQLRSDLKLREVEKSSMGSPVRLNAQRVKFNVQHTIQMNTAIDTSTGRRPRLLRQHQANAAAIRAELEA